MCIMVMLKAKDTHFSKTYSMGDHYLYQSVQYKNVSKYTLLNECNVITH